jgi:hypothetical protein
MIGRLDRLASLFEAKLQAEAQSPKKRLKDPTDKAEVLKRVATAIKDIYQGRIAPPKNNILRFLASLGERVSKHLIEDMADLAAEVDQLIQQPSQDQLLLQMANIRHDIAESKQSVRQAIHNSVDPTLPFAQREKERKHLKSKFEDVCFRLERMLIAQSDMVKQYVSPEAIQQVGNILSGKVSPKRKALPDKVFTDFALTSEAKKYGVDDLEVLAKIKDDPELKELLTTVINAIHRKQTPKDGNKLLQVATQIAANLPRQPTPVFEMPEEQAQQALQIKMDPGEQWSDEMLKRKQELAQEREEQPMEEPEKLEQQIQERDRLHQERQKQAWEEKLLSKYNNETSLYRLLRRNGISQ